MTYSRPWRQYFKLVVEALPSARGLLPLVALLVAWQLLQTGNSPYFPPPSDWWNGLMLLAKSGIVGHHGNPAAWIGCRSRHRNRNWPAH